MRVKTFCKPTLVRLFDFLSLRGILDTTLCDTVCQGLAAGWWLKEKEIQWSAKPYLENKDRATRTN